jgi:hypothetical protein
MRVSILGSEILGITDNGNNPLIRNQATARVMTAGIVAKPRVGLHEKPSSLPKPRNLPL